MGSRLDLHALLIGVLGTNNVHYQPPESKKIEYPCILYFNDDIRTNFADNAMYIKNKRYKITIIDSDPESLIPDKVLAFKQCAFDRVYVANNLYHHVFNIYF